VDDMQVESLLRRYEPARPAGGLRARVLSAADAAAGERERTHVFSPAGWAAIAAAVMISFGLHRAGDQAVHDAMAQVGLGPTIEAVRMDRPGSSIEVAQRWRALLASHDVNVQFNETIRDDPDRRDG
jgi:hypothetical protein